MKVIVKRRISMICAMIMLISSVLGHSMGVFAADETENSGEETAEPETGEPGTDQETAVG